MVSISAGNLVDWKSFINSCTFNCVPGLFFVAHGTKITIIFIFIINNIFKHLCCFMFHFHNYIFYLVTMHVILKYIYLFSYQNQMVAITAKFLIQTKREKPYRILL